MAQDNQALRALFTLPPIRESASTTLAVPAMPPQKVVTGDNEVDAVLWLQGVAGTGNQALIEKAREAAQRITTPMKVIERRYVDLMIVKNPGNAMSVAMSTFGFGDIEGIGRRALERAQRRHETLSRFGTEAQAMAETPAESACAAALHGMRPQKALHYQYNPDKAAKRFGAQPALTPCTLSDCLYVQAYWSRLYRLRNAFPGFHEDSPVVSAHGDYCFVRMTDIPPGSKAEALDALKYLQEEERMDWLESPAILQSLVSGGWT